jgi:hypothetical protein
LEPESSECTRILSSEIRPALADTALSTRGQITGAFQKGLTTQSHRDLSTSIVSG